MISAFCCGSAEISVHDLFTRLPTFYCAFWDMLSSRLIYHYERTLFSLRVTLLSQPEIAKSGAFVQNQIFLVSQSKLFFGVGIHIINNKAVCSYFAVLQTRCYRLIYN